MCTHQRDCHCKIPCSYDALAALVLVVVKEAMHDDLKVVMHDAFDARNQSVDADALITRAHAVTLDGASDLFFVYVVVTTTISMMPNVPLQC